SSSASVGILQAIAATGSLTYGAAIPIIMGQNIGTCITAILSSIGTNRNAKRTAVVHLLFNIIGTCICLALFYTLNAIVEFAFIGDSINALGIAIVHSTFNVICTALLLPFTKQLEKLVCLIIKDDKKTEEFQMLDDRLLATPSIAVEQCKKLSSEMANLARDGLVRSVSACLDYDATQAKIIAQEEDAVDMFEDKLGSYLVKLSQKTMSNSDSREISKILHTIGDLERISDRSVNISKATYELFEKKLSFTDSAKEELTVICDSLIEIVNLAVHAYVANDLESARQVEPLEQVVDFLKGQLKARHIERLQRGECTIEMGFIFSDLITNFERIADHCSNIAVCTIQLNENTFDTHEYLNTLKNSNNADFMNMYKGFKEKYQLPA
ncbi:MAG: Na/Pi symporter, partial [Oscillospiraceae bacterium]